MNVSRIFFFLCCAVVVAALPLPASGAFWGSSSETLTVTAEGVAFPESAITEQAKFYSLRLDGVKLALFAVRDTKGGVRVAMDACDACWEARKGYEQQERFLVCKNCGMRFHVDRIGLRRGGCNPHPVAFTAGDGTVRVGPDALRDSLRLFR